MLQPTRKRRSSGGWVSESHYIYKEGPNAGQGTSAERRRRIMQ